MSYGIGDKISKLRRAKNITQSQLAQYLYITPQTVSKWESGNGIPDIALLPKIAIFFDVSLDYLFDIADKQRIEDVILKYSVMRDDYSYGVALSMIESVLADETLKEADKAEYHALKGHLYLQKARDYISKSVTVTEKAMTYTDQNNRRSLSLQLYLLRIMNGEYKNVREEVEESYKSNKDCQSLFVYMEVLSMIQDYKTMMELIENDDIAKSIIDNKEVSAILMFAPEKYDDVLKKEFPKEMNYLRFDTHGVDVGYFKNTKGDAVIKVLKHLNIDKECAIAAGDSFDDISMFKEVGLSIAMGNGSDDAKEAANVICNPIGEHGLGEYLKKLFIL